MSWHLYFTIQIIKVKLQKLSLLCHCHQINQIFTNYYNSSVLRSPADSKITRCTPLFQRKSQVELKCKLAIRRSDNNYSLNGLFTKQKSVFTHTLFLKGYKSFAPFSNKLLNTVKSLLKINKVNTATLIYSLWQSSMSYSNTVKVKITGSLLSESKIHIHIIQRPKQSDIN